MIKIPILYLFLIGIFLIPISSLSGDLIPVSATSHVPQTDIKRIYDEVQDFRAELDKAVKEEGLKISHKDLDAWSLRYVSLTKSLKYVHAKTKQTTLWDKARKDLGYCHGQLEILKKRKVLSSMHISTS